MTAVVFQNALTTIAVKHHIGILTIKNGKQNLIADPVFIRKEELEEVIRACELKALILTGHGKNFSSGADSERFGDYKEQTEAFKEKLNEGKRVLDYIEQLPILTVALTNGACFGAGFEIALSCQFRIGCKNTYFSFPERNLGLLPGMGGTVRLPRLIGRSRAMELILSGDLINAQQALEWGILNEIVPGKRTDGRGGEVGGSSSGGNLAQAAGRNHPRRKYGAERGHTAALSGGNGNVCQSAFRPFSA